MTSDLVTGLLLTQELTGLPSSQHYGVWPSRSGRCKHCLLHSFAECKLSLNPLLDNYKCNRNKQTCYPDSSIGQFSITGTIDHLQHAFIPTANMTTIATKPMHKPYNVQHVHVNIMHTCTCAYLSAVYFVSNSVQLHTYIAYLLCHLLRVPVFTWPASMSVC